MTCKRRHSNKQNTSITIVVKNGSKFRLFITIGGYTAFLNLIDFNSWFKTQYFLYKKVSELHPTGECGSMYSGIVKYLSYR